MESHLVIDTIDQQLFDLLFLKELPAIFQKQAFAWLTSAKMHLSGELCQN